MSFIHSCALIHGFSFRVFPSQAGIKTNISCGRTDGAFPDAAEDLSLSLVSYVTRPLWLCELMKMFLTQTSSLSLRLCVSLPLALLE